MASILFQKQASLSVFGEMKQVPAENKAPGDRELHVDYYNIIGEAPGGPQRLFRLRSKVAVHYSAWLTTASVPT